MKALFNEEAVRKTFAAIVEPGSVWEIRALDAQLKGDRRVTTVSGYFDNVEACIVQLKRLGSAVGIYTTLNRANPDLLHRRANRLDYAGKVPLTSDGNILRRVQLLIDVDPVRLAGISSTDTEKAAAWQKVCAVRDYLKGRDWPEPLLADSGNGYHLLYLIDLPAEDNKLIEKVLTALANRFDGDGVKIDRSVFKPSQIIKLYGTLACKGEDTKERPHRLSKILKVPEPLEVVSLEQLQELVEELLPEQPAPDKVSAGHGTFDVEAFFQKHAIAYKKKAILSDGREMWIMEACPFNSDHCGTEVAVFREPSGKLGFECKHTSCIDKHWQDFRRHFEPGYDSGKWERQARHESQPGDGEPVELPPPPPPYVSPPLELFPDDVQRFIRAGAATFDVDHAFFLLPVLSGGAAMIGNARSIRLKEDYIEPPIIWSDHRVNWRRQISGLTGCNCSGANARAQIDSGEQRG